MMDIIYQYTKVRCNFGRQPMFSETLAHFLDSVYPDVVEQKKYCLRNPVHSSAQATSSMSEHDASTKKIEMATKTINHVEGGWPKDIVYNDEEATTRHIRRVERSEEYIDAVLSVSPVLENLIKQNNTMNIYHHFYKDIPKFESFEKPVIQRLNVYKEPMHETYKRPVACIGWTYEEDSKMVVAYCDKKYPATLTPVNTDPTCYIWDLASSSFDSFLPPIACWQIACSPISPYIIVGGLEDGRVCIFDIRTSKTPVTISQMHLAHREPVTTLVYIESRTSSEFFSGSTDGKCIWYDIRSLNEPIDSLLMSVLVPPGQTPNMSNTEPVSILQFSKIFPSRFLCGTDTGLLINVNRKAKSHKEIMAAVFEAHLGPVKSVNRNPSISKMIMSSGDFTTHIWSEDILSSPIITGTSQRYQIEDSVWSPYRVSGYMTVGRDGKFRYWDLLRKLREPIMVLPMSKRPLLKLKPQLNGRIVAMGDDEGTLYLLSLSENLTISGEGDKQLMTQMYERETHREHILEMRVKEIRMRTKADKETSTEIQEAPVNYEVEMATVEKEYRQIVLDEIKTSGIPMSNIRSSIGKKSIVF